MESQTTVLAYVSRPETAAKLRHLARDYRLLTADTLQRALHIVQQKTPRLIIADATAQEDGTAHLIQFLRTLPQFDDMRILLIVDACSEPFERFGLRVGADATICLPLWENEVRENEVRETVACLLRAQSTEEMQRCGGRSKRVQRSRPRKRVEV